ncbi:hypothetical protein MKX01_027716, partial [Papaver californicum]
GAIKLELPCTKNTTSSANNGVIITADHEPNWNLDSLLSELSSLELKLKGTSSTSSSASYPIVSFTKKQVDNKKVVIRSSQRQRDFVMRVSDEDDDDDDDDDDDREDVANDSQLVTTGRRFAFTYSSDWESSGDDDSVVEEHPMQLMDRVGLLDGVLAELEHERHQGIKEKVRNKVKTLETDLMHVYERSASALRQVEKNKDYRRELDNKLEMHHCRTIAEARENHLLEVQRKHEHRSQIEERKIQNADAAFEEARRKEQAFREEKMRQEKAKAETEDFRNHELQIGRRIKQISGNRDSVRWVASFSFLTIIIISIDSVYFARRSPEQKPFRVPVVSQCSTQSANFNSTAFACGHVIVLVTSQVPLAMDLLLAELHKACIYTVPKHFAYSKTEVSGVQNLHGLKEGWAWVARLLNSLPASIYTAVALNSFLEMAGFALFRAYKTQFRKILNFISRHFLDVLESKQDPKLNPIIMKLKTYINTKQFLKEPEGWLLKTCLLSEMAMPEANYSPPQQNYHSQQNYHAQQNYYPQQNRQYRYY